MGESDAGVLTGGRTGGDGENRRVLVLIGDLIFGSRVSETLKRLGMDAVFATSPAALEGALEIPFILLIADLHEARFEPLAVISKAKARKAAVLAYGSHVDLELLEAGRKA